jgi:hypothetical protein
VTAYRDTGTPLHIVPASWETARAFVPEWHRHHPKPPAGHKFCIGLALGDELVGVALVGRPVARNFDDGLTLEVNRTAVADNIPNGNSMLYGACWRAAKALGYVRLVTYTEAGETGASLRAAGYRIVAERTTRAGWDTPTRRRLNEEYRAVPRTLWEAS